MKFFSLVKYDFVTITKYLVKNEDGAFCEVMQ